VATLHLWVIKAEEKQTATLKFTVMTTGIKIKEKIVYAIMLMLYSAMTTLLFMGIGAFTTSF
jgi:hypothetical protein